MTDYVAEAPELMEFFGRPPSALLESAPRSAPWDASLVTALAEYQEAIGGRALFMGDEAVVMTGQQTGLLTGPLYTIYKAATAIRLAKKVHSRFGVACVPVFWAASDDHDFEEARTAHLLTKRHEVTPLRYDPAAAVEALPMYRVPLDPSLHGLVDHAASQAPGSEFRDEVAAFLHESLDASGSLADWTARILARLFRDTPLIVFVPHLPAARALAAPVIEQEIAQPLESTMLLNEAGKRLKEAGYHQQVAKGATACNFFIEMGGRRRKVLFEDERYVIPDEHVSCSTDELLRMLASAPERFSGNVALRCIVQQHLFPVAAYVAGPGEVAYWAQLRQVFAHFDTAMPAVYPRARCVLTTRKLDQLREKFGFALEDLAGPADDLAERALERTSRAPARDVLARHRETIGTALRPLPEELEPFNKTAARMARKAAQRWAQELDRVERTILKGDEAQAAAVGKQVARLCNALYPSRKPQERVCNIFSFLFEHGWGLVPRLIEEISVDSCDLKEIEL